jgi:hypothetical protein
MTPDRRNPLRGVTPSQVVGAAVTVALTAGALLLGGAPVWVGIAAAVVSAVLFGLAYLRDRRRGGRWF